MKFKLVLILLTIVTLQTIAQIRFEKGYIIDNSGVKTECLINNFDWNSNPSEFSYKIEESGQVLKGTVENIAEFKVYGSYKYVRVKTQIDQSPMDMATLSKERNPIWKEQTEFLKVLVDGKAVLYTYVNSFLIRFFYSVSGSEVKQLIYKEWSFDKGAEGNNYKLRTNETYKQQLSFDVPLAKKPEIAVSSLSYTKSQLIDYFKKYNSSFDLSQTAEVVSVDTKLSNQEPIKSEKRDFFNVKVAPGLIYSNSFVLDLSTKSSNYYHANFKSIVSPRFGLEAELIMPFNKNKWSVVFDGNYQKSEIESDHTSKGYSTLKYSYFEVSPGIRNYYYINSNSKLFLELFIVKNITDFDSKIEMHNASASDVVTSVLEINAPVTFAFGAGFEYKRLSFECRYAINKNLVADETGWNANYNALSFIVGYKIFQFKK